LDGLQREVEEFNDIVLNRKVYKEMKPKEGNAGYYCWNFRKSKEAFV